MLDTRTLPALQSAIADAGIDGWLLFDFQGLNPVATGLLQLHGMTTRRFFVFIPRTGAPVAITHAIEQGPWSDWPADWTKESYSGWKPLEDLLRKHLSGKKIAMEYSPGDAIPYLDRIPAGVVEMVRSAGATVLSSADLVSRFYAVWTEAQLESHIRASKIVSRIAQEAIGMAGSRADSDPATEFEIQQWIMQQFAHNNLNTVHEMIVAVGPNAANPHYEPTAVNSATIRRGDILLIDLFAREADGIFADQTWMASLGTPSDRDRKVWEAVSGARIAAAEYLRSSIRAKKPVKGGEVDDVARDYIVERGFGKYFIHRTGHSIDSRDLHGSGPHIDNFETREERLLLPGVGFSIEPGVYIEGEVGMRSEVNAYVGIDDVIITPDDFQRDLLIV
ncbi:MAG: aminopeptidase P family protein [Gemmatimonadaceae bacterium]|nr:aminopeptidase P family protein [Gemmatimonadaceae bacterium]